MSHLFEACQFGSLSLANRIVMAPMTRSRSPGATPNLSNAEYYRRRAEGGCGLIITEGTTVDHEWAGPDDPNIPNFHRPEALAGWGEVVKSVHAAGGKIAPQLWHVGTMRPRDPQRIAPYPAAGPSGLFRAGRAVGVPMTQTDIDHVVAAFAKSAAHARALGFDALELHGAHGYLIDQFFWEDTNQRTDRYGGSLVKRTQFAVEIIEAVRAAVGQNFPVILRFSQWKQQDYTKKLAQTPAQLEQFLAPLSQAGVDIFHCSNRRYWEPEFEGSDLNLAGWTKKITGKPTITVGGVGLGSDLFGAYQGEIGEVQPLDKLLKRLDANEFDLVAVGRGMLVDPEWANKVKAGRMQDLLPFGRDALDTYF
jgi:2,4-dienoyl-CoA reductase-like NADH-dependent reductase (Old Yellow Enzyme family)